MRVTMKTDTLAFRLSNSYGCENSFGYLLYISNKYFDECVRCEAKKVQIEGV